MKCKKICFHTGLIFAIILSGGILVFFATTYGPKEFKNTVDIFKLMVSFLGPAFTLLLFYYNFNLQSKNEKARLEDKVFSRFQYLMEIFKSERLSLERVPFDEKEDSKGLIEKLGEMPIYDDRGQYITETNSNTIIARYKEKYAFTSSYFKSFHRIIKTLNNFLENKIIDSDEYADYIGILRSAIGESEMRMILINSCLLERGIGLGIELIGSNFFGDKDDIEFSAGQHLAIDPSLREFVIENFIFKKELIEERKGIRKKYAKTKSQSNMTNNLNLFKLLNYTLQGGVYKKN